MSQCFCEAFCKYCYIFTNVWVYSTVMKWNIMLMYRPNICHYFLTKIWQGYMVPISTLSTQNHLRLGLELLPCMVHKYTLIIKYYSTYCVTVAIKREHVGHVRNTLVSNIQSLSTNATLGSNFMYRILKNRINF